MSDNSEKKTDSFESVTVCSKTAKCFLSELDEIHERWDEGTWVFRGQNDADWDPIPSLFRDWDNRSIDYEFPLISMYIRHINMVNLPVPADTIGFKSYTKSHMPTTLASLSHSSGYGYKYDYTDAIFAIAQHSGIPTRLLDFTYNPFIAAFFAAHNRNRANELKYSPEWIEKYFFDVLNKYQDSETTVLSALREYLQKHRDIQDTLNTDMAVWAVRVNKLADRSSLRLLDHPYSEILNLRSQLGVFICDTQPIVEGSEPGKLFRNELWKLISSGDIYKLTLPHTERQFLIDMLEKKRISPMYLKPSYEYVARRVLNSVARH